MPIFKQWFFLLKTTVQMKLNDRQGTISWRGKLQYNHIKDFFPLLLCETNYLPKSTVAYKISLCQENVYEVMYFIHSWNVSLGSVLYLYIFCTHVCNCSVSLSLLSFVTVCYIAVIAPRLSTNFHIDIIKETLWKMTDFPWSEERFIINP